MMLNFDYAANYPPRHLDTEELTAISDGNPHSSHPLGREANRQIEETKQFFRKSFPGYNDGSVIFVPGGGSLANRYAILQHLPLKPASSKTGKKNQVWILSTEHKSIHSSLNDELKSRGYQITYVPVEKDGRISLAILEKMLQHHGHKLALLSCSWVNNETGVVQPIQQIIRLVRELTPEAKIHSDAAHAVMMLAHAEIVPDLVTLSLYKIGAPHLGVVLAHQGINLRECYLGTPDTKMIVTSGLILKQYLEQYPSQMVKISDLNRYLREQLERMLTELGFPIYFLSPVERSVPTIVSLLLPLGYEGRTLQTNLGEKGLLVSSGSACSTSSKSGNHVLVGMGYDPSESYGSLRFSFSADHSPKMVDQAVSILFHELVKMSELIGHNKPVLPVPRKNEYEYVSVKNIRDSKKSSGTIIRRFTTPIDQKLMPFKTDTFRLSEGEIYLKKGNYKRFHKVLVRNLKTIMDDQLGKDGYSLLNQGNTFFLRPKDPSVVDGLKKMIQLIPGFCRFMVGMGLPLDDQGYHPYHDDLLAAMVASLFQERIDAEPEKKITFKIETTFRVKKYSKRSRLDWNYLIGQYIVDRFGDHVKVDLSNPELTVTVVITPQMLFVSRELYSGTQGLPVGSDGSGLVLLTQQHDQSAYHSLFRFLARGLALDLTHADSDLHYKKLFNLVRLMNGNARSSPVTEWPPECLKHHQVIIYDRPKDWTLPQWAQRLHLLIHEQKKLFLETAIHSSPPLHPEHLSDYALLREESSQFLLEDSLDPVKPADIVDDSSLLMLISGGLDSPVAAHLLTQEVETVHYVHFATQIDKTSNIQRLVARLATRPVSRLAARPDKKTEKSILHLVHFTPYQDEIVKHCPPAYRTILFKIVMLQIANKIATGEKLALLGTGDSLGQVASQTPYNLLNCRLCSERPIVAPLISWNKDEIIRLSHEIGTYEISIEGGTSDCCTLYLPKHPVIKSELQIIQKSLALLPPTDDFIKIERLEI